jgi:hypothetical protein
MEPLKTTSPAFAGTAQHSSASGIAARLICFIMAFELLFRIAD